MTEKQLIFKLQELKQIKPSNSWVVLTKDQIMGQEEKRNWASILETFPRWVFQYNRFAFASLVIFAILAGTFTFAQNSLPGDSMFAIKKISEKTMAVFASNSNLPKVQLEIANKRLDDVNKIAQTKQTNKLASAIEEFQANISKAAEDLTKTQNPDVEKMASQITMINEKKQQLEILGIVVGGTEDINSASLQLFSIKIKELIKDLETTTLTEEDKAIFDQAVEDFKAGNYNDSLTKILLIGY